MCVAFLENYSTAQAIDTFFYLFIYKIAIFSLSSHHIKPNSVLVLAFYHCDRIIEKINLMEERFILVHGFRSFSPRSLG